MRKYIPKCILAAIIASTLSLLSGNASISQDMQNLYKQRESSKSSAIKNCRWTWINNAKTIYYCLYGGNVWSTNGYDSGFWFDGPLGKRSRVKDLAGNSKEFLTQYNIEEGILVIYECFSRISSTTCDGPPKRYPKILNPYNK